MTHNLSAVAHIAADFQNKQKLPILGRTVVQANKKRPAPNPGGAGQRVGPRTQDAPAPVSGAAPTAPYTPQSSRISEAWQHKQAAGTLSTQQHEDVAASAAPTTTVHSPVQPTTKEVAVPTQGWSAKVHPPRAKMPTAQELLNSTQKKAAVKPKKNVQQGASVDLSAWDSPSV